MYPLGKKYFSADWTLPCFASGDDKNCLSRKDYSMNCSVWTDNFLYFTDIDECTAGVHTCLRGTATCINTIGSYNCSCNLGYVGDGRTSCYVQSAGQWFFLLQVMWNNFTYNCRG